jgi:WD40 repeat protein
MRFRVVVALVFPILAACTASPEPTSERGDVDLRDVVVLGTDEGSLVLSSGSGSVLAEDAGELAAPDGSALYRTVADGRRTVLETIDPLTGDVLASPRLDGRLEARVASVSGELVALMQPGRHTTGGRMAAPHARTTITVVDPAEGESAHRYRLDGNFGPEAFSVDDRKLFLIQYLPALAPEVYRVTYLDLLSGLVRQVHGRFKTPPERMPGIRLSQAFDGRAEQLYTLYTNRPAPGYGGSWDGEVAGTAYGGSAYGAGWSKAEVSFVHVLNLRDGWAYCAGLPRVLWGRPASEQAIVPSADGRHLFIVDSVRGVVADMDTRTLEILRTVRLDLSGSGGVRTSAVATPDGRRLFIGSAADGAAIYGFDAATLRVVDRWRMPGDVRGLALSEDGQRLFAALPDRVAVLDARTGEGLARLAVAGATVLHVATP